ncbi:MAG: PIN domain-containing protein [Acidobacteria bacterium]|nr:PIN domain-containing protein [Acidobacteriota bacterium]
MIVLDTSGLLAAIDAGQRMHSAAREALEADPGPFILSPFVLAEMDFLLATRVGADAESALLAEVVEGAYQLDPFGPDDVEAAARIVGRYRDLGLGLADASLVVLAARHHTTRLLTLDERHFRAVRPIRGRAFTILPADA